MQHSVIISAEALLDPKEKKRLFYQLSPVRSA